MVVHKSDQDFGQGFVQKSLDSSEGTQTGPQIQDYSGRHVDVVQDRFTPSSEVCVLFCKLFTVFHSLVAVAYIQVAWQLWLNILSGGNAVHTAIRARKGVRPSLATDRVCTTSRCGGYPARKSIQT